VDRERVSGMTVDGYGPDTANPAGYDDVVNQLLAFQPGVLEAADALVAEHPAAPMARVLRAYLGLLGTEPDDARAARDDFLPWLAGHGVADLLPRERAHVRATTAWLDGDMAGAARVLRELSQLWPRDPLALAVGHQIDFFRGDATALRDRIGGALGAWREEEPGHGFLLGMYAFGLEESGDYERAEEVGRAAVQVRASDVWAIHAVVHTYEMRGRFGRGIRYLDERRDDWTAGNFLNVHNFWHYCLYLLEAGEVPRALEIYDAVIDNTAAQQVAMEMLDAAALLWRLHLAGVDLTPRWTVLAEAWTPKMARAHYAFNDMHAAMSYVGAGRIADAGRLVAARERYVADPTRRGETNQSMTRDVGLPVLRAVLAFGTGDYDGVVDLLYPIRYRLNEFGGSHAQRDAMQKTLVEAALRAHRYDIARTLLSERISVRPCSPFNWLGRARLAEQVGDLAAAAVARGRAGEEVKAAGLAEGPGPVA
jgi:tetratricopeptide (TPR) repeat protein